jgi:deazaflavin-dependent oxidoreductase (nitroreductase family)
MKTSRQTLERDFFRTLNRFVEPAVRKGLLSPRCAPLGLILLESTGFKSGATRSTPLLATRVGKYTVVSTVRGKKSFWVKNLQKTPDISFHQGGRVKQAKSFVFTPETNFEAPSVLPAPVAAIASLVAKRSKKSWAFAVLQTQD